MATFARQAVPLQVVPRTQEVATAIESWVKVPFLMAKVSPPYFTFTDLLVPLAVEYREEPAPFTITGDEKLTDDHVRLTGQELALASIKHDDGVALWSNCPAATNTVAVSEAPVHARVYVVSARGVTDVVPEALADTAMLVASTSFVMLQDEVYDEEYESVENSL